MLQARDIVSLYLGLTVVLRIITVPKRTELKLFKASCGASEQSAGEDTCANAVLYGVTFLPSFL